MRTQLNDAGRAVVGLFIFLIVAIVGLAGALFVLDRQARSDDEVRVIEVSYLGGTGAITAGRVIFVHEGRADDADLLAHELVHVCQWEESGLEFLWDYSTEYLENFAELRDSDEAYREVSFEQEARAGDPGCDLGAYAILDE